MKLFLSIISILIGVCLQAQTPGSNIFDDSFLHEIRFLNTDTSYWIATKNYQMLDMIVDGNSVDSVGFKRKGNISAYPSTNKYGIKVKTNKYVQGKYYDGIKEFTLHINFQDPTLMREKMTYDICAEMGLFSLRTAFAKVYINNVYWGVYTIVEGKDEMYKHKFGDRSSDAIESLDFGDMCYLGNNVADYDWNNPGATVPRYELSNGNPTTAWPGFISMLDKANNTSVSQYLDTVPKYFNLEDFFTYQAINVYLMNFDSYISLKGNQIYVYDTLTKKWQVTPWDFNASFALWQTNNYNVSIYPMIPNSVSTGCIASSMTILPPLKNIYLDAMCSLINTVCDTTVMYAKIDNWKNQIQQAVYSDYRKVFSNTDFDNGLEYGYYSYNTANFSMTNIPALKTVLSERHQLIEQELFNEGYTCTVGSQELRMDTKDIVIYPNPFRDEIHIELPILDNAKNTIISITDMHGRTVKSFEQNQLHEGINLLKWNASDFANGVYLLNIKTDNLLQFKKLVLHR